MLNWDDPLGIGKKETAEKATVVEEATKHVAQTVIKKNAAPKQEPVVNHTPENIEENARIAVEPVNADDKRVVNGKTDINQLAPFKYPWAWKYFLNANKNHWTPLDVNMTSDVHDCHHKLNDDERHVYDNVLSYLTTSDILGCVILDWQLWKK